MGEEEMIVTAEVSLLELHDRAAERMKDTTDAQLREKLPWDIPTNLFGPKDPRPYYRYLTSLCEVLNPRIVIELGGETGVSATMMLAGMAPDATLYTVDIRPNWKLAPTDSRRVDIVGDVNSNLPIPYAVADLWFLDADHSYTATKAMWDRWYPRMKRGAIVLIDDIHLSHGYEDGSVARFWPEIQREKLDISELHPLSGFGMVLV